MEYKTDLFVDKRGDFLNFLKTRYSLFHLSNLFFRDLHYGVMAFLEMNGLPHAYSPSEDLAHRVVDVYEKGGVLVPIDSRSWMLNYLPFKKPPVKPAAPPKPAVPAEKPVSDQKPPAAKTTAAAATASSSISTDSVAGQTALTAANETETKPA